MWQRMMRVWLVGTAVAVVAVEGAPPEPPPMAGVVEPAGDILANAAEPVRDDQKDQDIIT